MPESLTALPPPGRWFAWLTEHARPDRVAAEVGRSELRARSDQGAQGFSWQLEAARRQLRGQRRQLPDRADLRRRGNPAPAGRCQPSTRRAGPAPDPGEPRTASGASPASGPAFVPRTGPARWWERRSTASGSTARETRSGGRSHGCRPGRRPPRPGTWRGPPGRDGAGGPGGPCAPSPRFAWEPPRMKYGEGGTDFRLRPTRAKRDRVTPAQGHHQLVIGSRRTPPFAHAGGAGTCGATLAV